MSSNVSQLWKVLESLGESSQFCATGSLAPVLPGLEVEGIGNVGVPVSEADARRIIQRASQAPFGRGEETIVDTNVRRVWQLEPGQFTLRNTAWDTFVDGIVAAVREEFGIQKKVEHELYKLLVYETGGFFAPHRDTEKIPGMFATLVVCLPSRHEGGTLIVTHDGETRRIDFGGDAAEFNVQYAAFYADCQHEITPVTSGHRVCLVYNLAIARQKAQPSAPANGQAEDAIAELLPQFFADDTRDKIVIPFKHQYTEEAFDPRALKGADRASMAVLARAAERRGYQVFVALLTHFQSGSPDYSTVSYPRSRRRYRRFDGGLADDISGESPDAQFEEVYEESRSLDHWINSQGDRQSFGKLRFEVEEVLSNVPVESWPYQQEISEATGNEGATMERWYRQAVVVIWPRERYFHILAREGPQHAVPALEELVAASADPLHDPAGRAFATSIIDRWNRPRRQDPWDRTWSEVPTRSSQAQKSDSLSTRMLTLLEQLGESDLVVRFVRDILPTACEGDEGPILSRLGDRFGWQPLTEPLRQLVAEQKPTKSRAKLAMPVSLFADLCCSPPKMTNERRAICGKLADELEQITELWDAYHEKHRYGSEPRQEIVESVFRAYTAVEDIDRLAQFVANILGKPKLYDLRTVLIPAVKTIHNALAPDSPGRSSFDQLLHHCLTELRSLTETPVEPPADWSREAKISCPCSDCLELAQFLRDPSEQVHRFPRRKDLRQHLHQQINEYRLDVTHETLRKGSPQVLVCTKNQATYERRLAQFQVDTQLLEDLEQLASTFDAAATTPSGRRRANAKKPTAKKPTVKEPLAKKPGKR